MSRPRTLGKRIRDRLESALVGAMATGCRFLPVGASVRFGAALGGLVGRIDRRRIDVARRNLELAYGATLNDAQRREIVRGVYRHFGRFLFEYLLLLTRRDLRPLSRFVEIDHLERTRAAVVEHGAAIFVTLHQGHWELLGGAFSELVTKVHAVAQPVRNPRLERRLVTMRGDLGMGLVERRNAVPALFRHLRRNQSVALLCDLNQKEGPEFVDFFGTPAATVRTPAVLAIRTGKPVIVGSSWSVGEPLRYRASIAEPIVPDLRADPEVETRRILVEMNRQLESFVRAHPEQWNWIHPRWRTRPPLRS
jgi:KDO2-lipid IV(A) lauroyltransferase